MCELFDLAHQNEECPMVVSIGGLVVNAHLALPHLVVVAQVVQEYERDPRKHQVQRVLEVPMGHVLNDL